MSQTETSGQVTHIGALRESVVAAMTQTPTPLAAILVAEDILPRLRENCPVLSGQPETYMGIPIYEDPGIEPGMVEMISASDVARRRLEMIRIGLTVTPEGLVKPAGWWRK